LIDLSDRPPTLVTRRLVLRAHEPADLDDVAAMWADERVTRFIGFTRTRQDSWFTMARYRGFWDLLGYGYWIARHRGSDAFIGELGFADFMRGLTPDLSGQPEAGWAFAAEAWGQGYATEATAAIHRWLDADGPGGPSVCVIDPSNRASLRVAERLGYEKTHTAVYGGIVLDVFRRAGVQRDFPHAPSGDT